MMPENQQVFLQKMSADSVTRPAMFGKDAPSLIAEGTFWAVWVLLV